MAEKISSFKKINFPDHDTDFVTRIVTEDYTILLRMRWCPIVESWFLNIRNSDNINVGFPIILKPDISVFTTDEEHGRIRSCMARPDGLPKGVGFYLTGESPITATSFKDGEASLLLLEE